MHFVRWYQKESSFFQYRALTQLLLREQFGFCAVVVMNYL